MIQRLFEAKISSANDPDYPRSELVQQLKHSALAIYQTSKLVCETICDVPESSPIVMFGFILGLQSLLHAAWNIVHPGESNDLISQLLEQYLQKARKHAVTAVEFTIDDLDEYIENLVELFVFRNEGCINNGITNIPNIIKTPNKMKLMFGRGDTPVHDFLEDLPPKRKSSPPPPIDTFDEIVSSEDEEPIERPTVLAQRIMALAHVIGDLEAPNAIEQATRISKILRNEMAEMIDR